MALLRSSIQRWYWRLPLKCLVMLAVTTVVLFPYPRLLIRQIRHVSNLGAMIEPNHPALAAWDAPIQTALQQRQQSLAEARARGQIAKMKSRAAATTSAPVEPTGDWYIFDDSRSLPATLPSGVALELRPLKAWDTLHVIQDFVYEKVRYDWDWNTWGMADYMPTVGEMFESARDSGGIIHEDCDGRAVMAASLMRRLGFEAQIVTDVKHVWVVTPQGEWMGPGEGVKALKSDPHGTSMIWLAAIGRLPSALSFGMSVFPWPRQAVLALTLFLLLYHRRAPRWSTAVGAILLAQGWMFLRCRVDVPIDYNMSESRSWPSAIGVIHVLAGIAWLGRASFLARRRAATAPTILEIT